MSLVRSLPVAGLALCLSSSSGLAQYRPAPHRPPGVTPLPQNPHTHPRMPPTPIAGHRRHEEALTRQRAIEASRRWRDRAAVAALLPIVAEVHREVRATPPSSDAPAAKRDVLFIDVPPSVGSATGPASDSGVLFIDVPPR